MRIDCFSHVGYASLVAGMLFVLLRVCVGLCWLFVIPSGTNGGLAPQPL